MGEVFVDTAGWLALTNASDKYASLAQQVKARLQQEQRRWVTTSYTLAETVAALLGVVPHATIVALIEGIRRSPAVVELVFVDEALEARGWDRFKRRPDKRWTLTDCISFVVMEERGIFEAFTADHHFEQAGFVKLL